MMPRDFNIMKARSRDHSIELRESPAMNGSTSHLFRAITYFIEITRDYPRNHLASGRQTFKVPP
ncbi:hypothetical protein QJS04_geneDACA014825 [Acorus gramineus]|uniref:Uncharacterized protein n=1 Tax=Acorus gramineus TaxID=55184 RepID=A0AAV9BQ59_ACOGR|nr:hypothetical protein QJS04_geneDACA014825 [Acorus gramineus]